MTGSSNAKLVVLVGKITFQVGCPTANYDRHDLILCLDGSKKLVLCKPRLRGMVIMQAIFFDLDGTLTESGPGIIKAVQYALNKMGFPEAVELYHAYYCKEGIFDNRVYPGIRQMLKDLRTSNAKLAVASSKPEILVRQILDHFGLSQYFDEVVGASMDGQRSKKSRRYRRGLTAVAISGPP